MSHRAQRTLQSLILASFGLFLLQRLWSGTLYWYLDDRFFMLVLGAAIVFLILARSALPAWQGAGELATAHAAARRDDHERGRGAPLQAWRLWLVALPVILGVLVPGHPLGSSAIANTALNLSMPRPAAAGSAPEPASLPPTERTMLDWVRAFHNAGDVTAFAGEPADVIGFVYHDRNLGEGEFMLSRFTANCCAAGASGLGLRVQWPNAAALEGDAWVRVRGTVRAGTYAGRPIPVIAAESIVGVEPPLEPYLDP